MINSEFSCDFSDLWNQLNRAGSVAYTGNITTLQLNRMVPPRRMESRTFIAFHPFKIRHFRMVKLPNSRNKKSCCEFLSRIKCHSPYSPSPVRFHDLCAMPDMRSKPELICKIIHVFEDLLLFRPFEIPSGIRRKRVAIKRTGDVTLCARIGIFPPRSSNRVSFLKQHKVVSTIFLQFSREAQACKASSDYDRFKRLWTHRSFPHCRFSRSEAGLWFGILTVKRSKAFITLRKREQAIR